MAARVHRLGAEAMTIALWICTLPLIAEFLVAPFNLWSGRTMPNFTRFTALSPILATRIFAPLKLAGALLLAAGLASRGPGAVGAGLIGLISGAYLLRLAAPGRRHLDGLIAFGLTFALAIAVLALQLGR